MADEYLAKSNPLETIEAHTEKLLQYFDQVLAYYGCHFSDTEKELIRTAAQYHDLGKMSYPFQLNIRKACGQKPQELPELKDFYQDHSDIPHGYLSPAFMPLSEFKKKYPEEWVFALINAVYYHHTRPEKQDVEVMDVIHHDLKPRLGDRFHFQTGYLSWHIPPNHEISLNHWEKYLIIKGMLNRIDYAASSGGSLPAEMDPLQQNKNLTEWLQELMLKRWQGLREIQVFMLAHRDQNLVVTASTGIGKTEAALLWGGDGKLFYTLPLKVSINAIYDRIANENPEKGYGWKKCILLHSDALSYLIQAEPKDTEDAFLKYKRSRFFSYPVTVCTVDQIFTFVYRYLGSEMIPATLKYSKIIIDEIQAYSPEITARLIFGLKVITDLGGKFAIITATLPPVIPYLMKQENIEFDMAEKPFLLQEKRHFISYQKTDFNDEIENLIIQAGTQKKVLVLCNTVRKACQVYQKLVDMGAKNIHLLHSRFQKRHRRMLEDRIQAFSKDADAAGIWVSTQIVEASLDIDFDLLITEMCPADNLLQRLGRCYRKRPYEGNTPNVYILDTGNGVGTVYGTSGDHLIYDLSVQYLQPYCSAFFTEEQKIEYINAVYAVDGLRGSHYFSAIQTELNNLEDLPFGDFSKDEAIRKFRNIMDVTVMDEVQFQKLNTGGFMDRFKSLLSDPHISPAEKMAARDELMSYTISISFNSSRQKGLVDSCPINPWTEIYRVRTRYDFDEKKLTGIGLTDEPLKEENSL